MFQSIIIFEVWTSMKNENWLEKLDWLMERLFVQVIGIFIKSRTWAIHIPCITLNMLNELATEINIALKHIILWNLNRIVVEVAGQAKKRDYGQSLSVWPFTAKWFYGVHFKSNWLQPNSCQLFPLSWHGKNRWRAYTTPTSSYLRSMYVCRSLTFGLPTYFASNLFLLTQYICALLFGGVSRKTVFLANVQRSYICWLLFDFGTSVNCYM